MFLACDPLSLPPSLLRLNLVHISLPSSLPPFLPTLPPSFTSSFSSDPSRH